jgi:haloalkane dehalogenase
MASSRTGGQQAKSSHGDVPVLGTTMHYRYAGPDGPSRGAPVLFLHGNPTSSFLWRAVIGPVAALTGRRCVAVDLVGMGGSGKPDIGYRLADHIHYVSAFLDAAGLGPVVVVGHDWGAVIALHLAGALGDQVPGVAFMEGHIHPIASWDDMGEGGRAMFQELRTPGAGERMVLEENFFIERVLPSGMLRVPTKVEMSCYRQPYIVPASRRPMLVWAREIPIEGDPADVVDLVLANQRVIADAQRPALLHYGDPGAVIGAEEVAWCRKHGRAFTMSCVGPGTHFLPEDQPRPIADALAAWLATFSR